MTGKEKSKQMVPLDTIDFLPDFIKEIIKKNGIIGLREFQVKALKKGLKGSNLVISAPTGSGKTLVGEILALIETVIKRKKALFLVPYKALAEELYNTLKERYPIVRVGISTGDYKETPSSQLGIFYDIIVMTYEKADMLMRESPAWLKNVNLLIVDEIHLIDDIERGSILDALITRLIQRGVQIIALSATITNAKELASWMKAKLITSNIRPVKLIEGVYLPRESKIYFYDPKPEEEERVLVNVGVSLKGGRTLLDFLGKEEISSEFKKLLGEAVKIKGIVEKKEIIYRREKKTDENVTKLLKIMESRNFIGDIFYEHIVASPYRERTFIRYILDLVYDLFAKAKKINASWQILIFRRSRQLSQKTAERIAEMMNRTRLHELFPEARNVSKELLESVEEISPLTESLANVLKYGVAFHHAGLTREERKIVESAFKNRKIGVIVATPTLGAGINLPARRVVVEHLVYEPLYGMRKISVAHYKQRGGRAGRPGLDTVGESILIAKNINDLFELFKIYIFGKPEPVSSKLGAFLPELRKQLLATIVMSENGCSEEDILSFFTNTFYAWQAIKNNDFLAIHQLRENVRRGLEELQHWGYVIGRDSTFMPTLLGKKVSLLYLDPLSGRIIIDYLEELKKKRIKKVPPDEVFFVLSRTPDIEYFKLRLLQDVQKLAKYILLQHYEFKEEFSNIMTENRLHFVKMVVTSSPTLFPVEEEELASLGIVAILIQWINLRHIKDILEPLSPAFSGGDLRELTSIVEWLLYCMRELGGTLRLNISVLKSIDILRRRVGHGVTEDLLEIVEIPGIGRIRASILKRYGYASLNRLAKASITSLTSLPGIGEVLAKRLIEYAKRHIKEI